MPQIFKVGGYLVYFWVNENNPLEPIHVHVSEGKPSPNATKIWITRSGRCLLQNNHSAIPEKQLHVILQIVEARSFEIIRNMERDFWKYQLLLLIDGSKDCQHEHSPF